MSPEIPVVLLVALQLADIATTIRILRAGGVELNPVMRWLMRFGALWIILKLVMVAIAAVGLYGNPWIWAAVAMQVAVVAYNLRSL